MSLLPPGTYGCSREGRTAADTVSRAGPAATDGNDVRRNRERASGTELTQGPARVSSRPVSQVVRADCYGLDLEQVVLAHVGGRCRLKAPLSKGLEQRVARGQAPEAGSPRSSLAATTFSALRFAAFCRAGPAVPDTHCNASGQNAFLQVRTFVPMSRLDAPHPDGRMGGVRVSRLPET